MTRVTDGTMPSRPSALVFAALRNERALDRHYRTLNPQFAAVLRGTPDYKPMWQVGVRRRWGSLIFPLLLGLAIAFAFANFVRLAGLLRLRVRARLPLDQPVMLATVPPNRALILTAVRQAPDDSREPVELTHGAMIASLSAGERWLVARDLFDLYGKILGARADRFALLLHARDALPMLVLAGFARQSPERVIWTDDHYQRWAFVISHATRRLRIVQHGFFDDGIRFPSAFGHVDLLAVRHERFVPQFAAYFSISRWYLFANEARFSDSGRKNVLFLASSAPHIDDEIALLQAIRPQFGRPIVVKLHPAHHYDGRSQVLIGLADIVCAADQQPRAEIFVSHSSFMEFDYAAAGAATCSIQRAGGVGAAADWILAQAATPGEAR